MIDFINSTMGDVIARSIRLHPSLLRDVLRLHAKNYIRFAAITDDTRAAENARRIAKYANYLADAIDDGTLDLQKLDLRGTIQAFTAACELQSIPQSLRDEIAARGATRPTTPEHHT